MTYLELVRSVASEHGQSVSNDEAYYILWEHTGFPSFWESDPELDCRRQVHEYFKNRAEVNV